MTDPTPAQLDRFVAEKVMGWTVRNDDFAAGGRVYVNSHGGDEIGLVDYRPTTDPAQALEALETWCEQGESYYMIEGSTADAPVYVHLVRDVDGTQLTVEAPTLPLAICKALVEAVGGERCS
jgi:hypothetical protein